MEIFYNSSTSGYEEISGSGPKWWTEYREMDAVYMFEGWLLDVMAKKMEQEVKNIFPSQADYPSLAEYEKMLCIEQDEGITIDERRRVVQAYYSGTGKLSKSVIQSIVRTYGECDSELWWNDRSCLNIRIFCNDGKLFSNKRIYQIIERRFPAHLLFVVRNVICGFETKENAEFGRMKCRTGFSWWEGCLDGSYFLDGEKILDTEFPPLFRSAHRIRAETENQVLFQMMRERFECETSSEAETVVKHRVLMNWWEELKTLDGNEMLDGSWMINQDVPPYFPKEIHRMSVQNEEDFSVSMYIPAKAKLLDGSFVLDGTINLNSGREVL